MEYSITARNLPSEDMPPGSANTTASTATRAKDTNRTEEEPILTGDLFGLILFAMFQSDVQAFNV